VSISEKLGGIIRKYGNSELAAGIKRSRIESLGIKTSSRGEMRDIFKN